VHVKTPPQSETANAATHANCCSPRRSPSEDLRGPCLTSASGGRGGDCEVEARIKELVENCRLAVWSNAAHGRRVLREQFAILTSPLLRIVRDDEVCRRLMTGACVGPVVALTIRSVDVPHASETPRVGRCLD